MRKLSLAVISLIFSSQVVSAQVDFDRGGFNFREYMAAVADHTTVVLPFLKPAPKEWTIMVFINGKNDLEPFALKDMNEMELVGSRARLNIVVEVGRIAGYDASDGDWKGTRRYLITKDNDTSKVSSKVVADLGKVDMGDYRSLAAFGKWAKTAYPAKKYMLIVWNHGSGWTKNGEPMITKGISYDQETGNHITTPQLGQALREIGKLDVYGSDACLMQMAEVVYEIKDYATYIVGSEETEPGDGYTYNTFLAPVAARPTMSPAALAKVAVDAYSDHYRELNMGSTQSVVKAAAIPRLLTLTNQFAYAVTAAKEKELARSARDGAVTYAIKENKDLYDFVRQVVAGSNNANVKAKGQALMTFITSELVAYNRTNNSPGGYWNEPMDYSPSKGIAAYFTAGTALGAGYTDLRWAKYSNWDEFVLWLNQP